MGRVALRSIMAFLAAATAGYILAIGIGLVLSDYFNVSQLEGANAMGLIFMIGPTVALISGTIAAIFVGLRTSARMGHAPPRAGSVMLQIVGAVVGATLGNAVGTGLQKLVFAGQSFEIDAIAFLIAFLPELAMIGGALGGIALARRVRSRDTASSGDAVG